MANIFSHFAIIERQAGDYAQSTYIMKCLVLTSDIRTAKSPTTKKDLTVAQCMVPQQQLLMITKELDKMFNSVCNKIIDFV